MRGRDPVLEGCHELVDDLADRLDLVNAAYALAGLPVLRGTGGTERRFLEAPKRGERVKRSHPVLHFAMAEHEPGDRVGARPEVAHVLVVDHRDRHSGQALRENDIVRCGVDDRLLVVRVGKALGGSNEAGAHLHTVVAEVHHATKGRGIADAARADDGQAEVAYLIEEALWRQAASMATRDVVDGDQTVHTACDRLERPLPLGHVVVDHPANRGDPVHDPSWVAERGDEEPNTLLDRDVYPFLEPVAIHLGRLLDEGIHAKRARRGSLDELESLTKVVAVHVGERHRLYDANGSCVRRGSNELRIEARVHRATDDRVLDPNLAGERCGARRHGAESGREMLIDSLKIGC